MSKYTATVVKTGNSLALRVPKQYAVEANLKPGEKVQLPLPKRRDHQDRAEIVRIIGQLQAIHALSSIKDPIAWQREQRRDRPDPRDQL